MQQRFKILQLFFICIFAFSCSHVSKEDPLQNTKRIVKEEHVSLYQNGAFQVPSTKMKLIPSGAGPVELAGELAGVRARESFLRALKNAGDSVEIVVEGSKKSYTLAKNVSAETNEMVHRLNTDTQGQGTWVIYKSTSLGRDIIGKSWTFKPNIEKEMQKLGLQFDEQLTGVSQAAHDTILNTTQNFKNDSINTAEKFAKESSYAATGGFYQGKNDFVLGYMALPDKIEESVEELKQPKTFNKFVESFKDAQLDREKLSGEMVDVVNGEVKNYSNNVSENFNKAGQELKNNSKEVGFTLASLKALRWTLQGIFWDGAIKPIGNIVYGGLGYLVINGIVYPATLVGSQTQNVGELIVEVTRTSGTMVYEVIAPTGKAGFAVLIASGQWLAGQAVKGASNVVGYAAAGAGRVVAPAVKYTGSTVGSLGKTTIQYVGVPLAVAGVGVIGTVSGSVVGVTGIATGGAIKLGTTAASGVVAATGHIAAGATLVGGTMGSVVLGIANSLYEVGKATVVPASYALTGGVVLTYGTMSQLAAHSLLAVSDAAYLVLSMEGPSYVVYAVTGKLNKGENIPVGSVLDLEKMQNSGEEFKKLDLRDEDVNEVIQHMESDFTTNSTTNSSTEKP
jgi:hypothetical protein